ncbi:MAG: DUF3025 domain-containing protein [Gallionella sp.]|nr:DUF3025 domain-containing protein [Gallionella sp.]
MRTEQNPEWNREALLQSPLFAPLHPLLAGLGADSFPTLQDCNALLEARAPSIAVQNGMPLKFVPQQQGKLSFEAQYEPRCYLTGEVQMRADNWHDLFNALVWLAFPATKAAINARHYRALAGADVAAAGRSQRGAVRDVNTLLDESGVIVACADVKLAGLLVDFKWRELFWQRRERVTQSMGFYLLGHGLYEKSLRPYVGITGQGLLVSVGQEFFAMTPARQLEKLDRLLADRLVIQESSLGTRDLCPVPLLGIPGWASENNCERYYDNTAYFRPGRRS